MKDNKLFYFSMVILAGLIVYFYIEKNNPEFFNHKINNWKNEVIPQEKPDETDSEIPEVVPETKPEVKPEEKPNKPIIPEPKNDSRKHRHLR